MSMSLTKVAALGIQPIKQRLYREDKDPYWPRVRDLAREANQILVFGAGRGWSEPDLRGTDRHVTGLDVSSDVFENRYLDEPVCYDGGRFPFPDDRFDMCCAYSVLEHLEHPLASFCEIARVLRPSGRFVFRTSNALFYACLLARLVPNRLHPTVIRFATGRAEQDTFPTFYRANTRSHLRSLLSRAGFAERELHVHLRGAGYLEFSLPTYLLGVLYERLVNNVALLEDLRASIVGEFVRATPCPQRDDPHHSRQTSTPVVSPLS
jgi:SAM-dependent methyltransferase